MALGLDLSQSKAKIARANAHIEALKTETQAAIRERNPYTAKCKVNKKRRGYSIFICSSNFSEPQLGIILGDAIHNLRSALDYIITALAKKSGATLTTKHQFPIFEDATGYKMRAGNMLGGIKYGLAEIESVQPFKSAAPQYDPLFVVNFFSNADLSGHFKIAHPWALENRAARAQ